MDHVGIGPIREDAGISIAQNAARVAGTAAWRPTGGCLFAGMGGFASGVRQAGFDLRWASDQDAAACQTLRHRHPDVRVVRDDVRNVCANERGICAVDVLAAGFPCQSFS